MDREYKEIMFSSMFDELDRVQVNKLYTDNQLQKEALNIGGTLKGVGAGFKSLYNSPKGFFGTIRKSYTRGSTMKTPKGTGGLVGGVKRVMGTDEGKALATGVAGVGAAGALIAGRDSHPQVVVNNR